MKIQKLFVALVAANKAIDFTADGRTYQVCGDRRMAGMYERLFPVGSHPVRRRIGEDEAQAAINRASEIRLWTGPTQFRALSAAELEAELAPIPVR